MTEAETTAAWSTDDYPGAERYDAWEHQLNTVFCNWDIASSVESDFHATLRHRSVDGLKVIDCVCDPCGATRKNGQMGRDDREILCLTLVLDGREIIRFGHQQMVLEKGDILLWDNTRPITFRVQERLHKLSFIMPLSRFKNWLPGSWHAVDHKIESGSKAGRLLSLYMKSMTEDFLDGEAGNGDALTEATMGLLVNAVGRQIHGEDESLRGAQMLRVRHFIRENLDKPELGPAYIAAANKISVRYLHWLFEPLETTVTQYIIQKRLLRCRRELSNPLMRNRTITDVAFSWGFHNSSHFSRRFKQEFGLPPNDFRKQLLEAVSADGRCFSDRVPFGPAIGPKGFRSSSRRGP